MEQHPRGVFEPEFSDPGGNDMFVAIDGEGRIVAYVSVPDPARRKATLRSFRQLLNIAAPEDSSLRLLR